ncbi:MAG TPA: LysM peptidoglycan-binding domain-containing protein [Bacteroidia bacterium]|nr:LysM peptidoglycan-binding domain-containing protein [Bacteroidia bacterium]
MNRILAVFVVALLGLVPSLRAEPELFTNVYVVPPTFLSVDGDSPRKSAKEILESAAGVTFGPGASAIYNPSTNQLIVRNTQDQMELVEAYIESIVGVVENQIFFTVREASFRGELPEDLKGYFDFPELPVGREKGEWARAFDSYESFREELARPPKPMLEARAERRMWVAGKLDDPQFKRFIQSLEKIEGVEILTSPSVAVRSGRWAITQTEQRRYGIQPVLGANESTIDLQLLLPEHGKTPVGEEIQSLTMTVNDGETVVVAEKNADGVNRLVFVTAQVVDPAGMPIQKTRGKPSPDRAPVVTESRIDPPKKSEEAAVETPAKTEPEPMSIEEQNAVPRADKLALRASELFVAGDTEGAAKAYEEALSILPEHEYMGPRRKAYTRQLARTLKAMSRRTVTSHIHIVREGETLEQIAERFGVGVEALRAANRLDSGPLKTKQLLLVPLPKDGESRTVELLKDTVLPSVSFSETTLAEALAMLQEEILRLHDPGLFPEATPVFVVDVPVTPLEKEITLGLVNVPATEAIRYTAALAECRYTVDGREVRILPLKR